MCIPYVIFIVQKNQSYSFRFVIQKEKHMDIDYQKCVSLFFVEKL
jgi:hypothetical protein